MRERKYAEAEKQLQMSLKLDNSHSPVPYENYGWILIQGFDDNIRAIHLLKAAKQFFPKTFSICSLLAYAYAREYQYTAAIKELEPLVSPDSQAELFGELGWLYEEAGEIQKALAILRTGFLKYKNDPKIINNLAYALLAVGEIDEARMVLESCPKEADPDAHLSATKGLLQLYEGNIDAARWLYKRAESLAKKTTNKDMVRRVRQKMHLEFAKYFLRTGDIEQAKKEIISSRGEKVKFFSYASEISQVERLLGQK